LYVHSYSDQFVTSPDLVRREGEVEGHGCVLVLNELRGVIAVALLRGERCI